MPTTKHIHREFKLRLRPARNTFITSSKTWNAARLPPKTPIWFSEGSGSTTYKVWVTAAPRSSCIAPRFVAYTGSSWTAGHLAIKVSPDDVGSPERFDISAVVLLRDVYFEASYDYTSPTQVVSGQVHGKIDTVSLDMIIGHPAGLGVPEVISFKVTKYTGVRLSERSVGALNEKIIEATGKALNKCMEDAISHRVLPVLNNLLKTMPFPGFT
ncbi:hypothetical protein MTO96_012881 [Rhipicephalus appendiculatus]